MPISTAAHIKALMRELFSASDLYQSRDPDALAHAFSPTRLAEAALLQATTNMATPRMPGALLADAFPSAVVTQLGAACGRGAPVSALLCRAIYIALAIDVRAEYVSQRYNARHNDMLTCLARLSLPDTDRVARLRIASHVQNVYSQHRAIVCSSDTEYAALRDLDTELLSLGPYAQTLSDQLDRHRAAYHQWRRVHPLRRLLDRRTIVSSRVTRTTQVKARARLIECDCLVRTWASHYRALSAQRHFYQARARDDISLLSSALHRDFPVPHHSFERALSHAI